MSSFLQVNSKCLLESFTKFGSVVYEVLEIPEIVLSSSALTTMYSGPTGGVSNVFDEASFKFSVLLHFEDLSLKLKASPEKKARTILEALSSSFRKDLELLRLGQRLMLAESRYGTIFDQSPLSIQICSPEGRTLAINPAWKNLWQISDDVIENFILRDYNMLEDEFLKSSGVMKHIERGYAGEVSRIPIINYDPKVIGTDGVKRWVEGWMYPSRDEKGTVKEIVLIHIDVSEKEKLVEELILERNRLTAVLSQMPAGVLVLDKKTNKFIVTNELLDRIEGRSLAGETYSVETYPELSPLSRSLRGEFIESEETLLRRPDGSSIQLRVSSAPVRDQKKEISAAVLVATDVSRLKRLETHEKFLTKVSSILIATLDYEHTIYQIAHACVPEFADGCMIDLVENEKISRLLTYHTDAATQLLMEELQRNYQPTINSPQPGARAIRTGTAELLPVVDLEKILERTIDANHTRLITEIGINSHISVPLFIRGKVIGSISLLNTTNRQKFDDLDLATSIELARQASLAIENAKLYDKAQRAIHQRDEFISIASHELKTPITSMQLQLQLAEKIALKSETGLIDASYVSRLANMSTKQLHRITLLVEDMLDISRIDTGKLALNLQMTDVSKLIQEVLCRFAIQLEKSHIRLTTEVEENVFTMCDAYRIEQVINNLITNAIRYGDNKPIVVSLSTNEHCLEIRVIDQGSGIDPEDHQRIFERFERAVSASNISGLGLGLFISREIMEQHHGKLTVSSELGKGSVFLATVPLIST